MAKVVIVLGFCLLIGLLFVSPANWVSVFSGFLKFGNMPVIAGEDLNGNGRLDAGEDFDRDGRLDIVEPADERDSAGRVQRFEDVDGDGKWDGENVANPLLLWLDDGTWPAISLAQIVVIGAFAGYAGGGGLGNSTYSNFVRDKGWGMGSVVGAIPSAVGGKHIALSHLGSVFPLTPDNLRRWHGWWRYILTDQFLIWAPGCFVGMALPALLSLQFARYSTLATGAKLEWAQALITADGLRHAPQFSPALSKVLWLVALFVGLMVMLPSQMSVVDDFSRRWTDILWSGSRRVRETFSGNQVKRIYYSILFVYVLWTVLLTYLFTSYGSPKQMTSFIANFNNLAIGATAFHLLWINTHLLPAPLRPRWYCRLGLVACGLFYLGLAALVFITRFVL